MPHSGLQRSVLQLYRRALRTVRTKPPHSRPKFLLTIRHAFRVHARDVSPRDVSTVDVLVRRVRRRVEMWEDPNLRDCWITGEMLEWERQWRDGWARGREDNGAGSGADPPAS